MIEHIEDFILITFKIGKNERYLLKGCGQCEEFETKQEALAFIKMWYSLK